MALLEVKRTSAADFPKHIKALICGPAGSGKTLISTTFPNPWFLSAEGGLMSIIERDIPYTVLPDKKGTSTYDALQQVVMRLDQPPGVRLKQFGFPVDTLVIDTIDEVSRLLLSERKKKEHHDVATLQDYGWLKDTLTLFVQSLRAMDIHVVLTCHLKSKDINEESLIFPAIEGGFSERVADYVDLAMILKSGIKTATGASGTTRVIERYLQTFPDSIDWIKDRSGKLPQEFPVNFDDDYLRLATLIYGKDKLPTVTDPDEAEAVEAQEENTSDAAEAVVEAVSDPVAEPRYECAECQTKFDDEDQHDSTMIKFERVLCAKCAKKAA